MSDVNAPPEPAQQPIDVQPAHDAKRSLTRKQRRIGERLAELTIFAVATISIIAIFLIFLFVFREASPIFFGSDDTAIVERDTATVETPSTVPATDSSGSGDDSTANLTSTASDSRSGEMEVYNAESGDEPIVGGEIAGLDTAQSPPAADAGSETGAPADATDYPILTHDSQVRVSHLWYEIWQPNSEHPRYGIIPIVMGTLKTTLIALLIATPLGIFAAIYTAFFAPHWVREYLKPVIELLAAFPSVVVGFFCLMTVASIVQSVFGNEVRLNALVGGIGLAIAVVPIIYTLTDDALRAVPRSLREAALALGASEWQAAYQVLLPAATPGIVAAVLLGLGRAFGETMIALMATGNGQVISWDFFVSVRTFAATIGAEMGEVVTGSPHYQVLFFLGVLLFLFSFIVNFVAEFYVKQRLVKKFRGTE